MQQAPSEHPARPRIGLSKSRYVIGLQCHKRLWWEVHESDAPELGRDAATMDVFAQGNAVGVLARSRFPEGTLIDRPSFPLEPRVARTKALIEAGASVLFEASFIAGNVYVAADILIRESDGWRLIEVKAANGAKAEHIEDVALQMHVIARSGLDVRRVEVMHLNPEFRHPDHGDLFKTTDVTTKARALQAEIPGEIWAQLELVNGTLPDVSFGPHCTQPHKCPFMGRCWPQERDHITHLYRIRTKKALEYMAAGVSSICAIPPEEALIAPAERQIRAVRANALVVDKGLTAALSAFDGTLGFLDFETVSRAIPVWNGTGPWEHVAAQFSYHETLPGGGYRHVEFLADGPEDCRPALARALVDATAGADRVVMYTDFEDRCIQGLERAVPALAVELGALRAKLLDLKKPIMDFVYHPDFKGGFGLKDVLEPLVPDASYEGQKTKEGRTASVQIAQLLFGAGALAPQERAGIRSALLSYCKQDTWATVRVLERLRELAATHDS